MTGGNGADTYVVDSLLDVVVETAAASTGDKVMSAVLNLNLTDFANIENLELTGTATSVSHGNGGVNFLFGNAGNNTVDGGAGTDTMEGRAAMILHR